MWSTRDTTSVSATDADTDDKDNEHNNNNNNQTINVVTSYASANWAIMWRLHVQHEPNMCATYTVAWCLFKHHWQYCGPFMLLWFSNNRQYRHGQL